jgi:Pyridine nucleotide-disulphide oxidoreductase
MGTVREVVVRVLRELRQDGVVRTERDAVIDCAVVGAGPAGLAASAALTRRGVEHVVLERGRVGQSWREQRWDSLRLNNPGWMKPMLGEQAPDTYLTAGEVVEPGDADAPIELDPPTALDLPAVAVGSVVGNFLGFPTDAATAADAVVAHLTESLAKRTKA